MPCWFEEFQSQDLSRLCASRQAKSGPRSGGESIQRYFEDAKAICTRRALIDSQSPPSVDELNYLATGKLPGQD
jgi:hypothetical protein